MHQCGNSTLSSLLFSLPHSLTPHCGCTFCFLLPSCLPLPFPSTSLPLFSLTLKSTQSLRSPSFPAPTCWQEEKQEDAALYSRCILATFQASARCRWLRLSLSLQLSQPERLTRGGGRGTQGYAGVQELLHKGPQQEQQQQEGRTEQLLLIWVGNH